MNIAVIPDSPVKKVSKLLPIQKEAGFVNSMVDLSVFVPEQEIEYCKDLDSLIKTYLKQCKELKLEHTIGRAPYVLTDDAKEKLWDIICQLTRDSIRICSEVGCKYIVIEPLIREPRNEGENRKNIDFYLSFAQFANEQNIMILIRNNYRNYNGNLIRSCYSDAYKLNALVDELNKKSEKSIYGICLDIGVCNLCGQNMYETITQMGSNIKAVILRENDGLTDNALIPFSSVNQLHSKMDWLNLIRGLRTIGFAGDLIYDFRDSMYAVSHLLRKEIVDYAKKMIDFLVWQIEMEQTIKKYEKRVLFGAGNMCRNYMKCYGEEYPPLFTCDNNAVLWGTEFEGLEIKKPEELIELDSDVAVFICNIFYDEIEQQLLKMGICNPIEKFNDEYLPFICTE